MRAWRITRPGPVADRPLVRDDLPDPVPGPGEIRIRVTVCGVCRTDLHLAEGDLPLRRPGTVPGHEVVGTVDELGPGASRFVVGDRVGIAWLRSTCGSCEFCLRGSENLCTAPAFTGWDADGGYADHAVVDENYAYPIPAVFTDEQAAPLLCAGIIGYRALLRAKVPDDGRLGIYGFGGSAHLAAQVAIAQGARVHVLTRAPHAKSLALELGAASATDPQAGPPEPLDCAIVFSPNGESVPQALAATRAGGTVAVAGIHLSDIPPLRYTEHLFGERELRSVTANTRADGAAFLSTAARIGIRVHTVPYPFESADRALTDLAHGRLTGAAVIRMTD